MENKQYHKYGLEKHTCISNILSQGFVPFLNTNRTPSIIPHKSF